MSLAEAFKTINATAFGYMSSWALLTASELGIFDRLPARTDDLLDICPDPHLTTTWLLVLAENGLVSEVDGVWSQSDEMAAILVGEKSYAAYLGTQVAQQLAPRLTLGTTGGNVLRSTLANPDSRTGYEGWFADIEETTAYQASQFDASIPLARTIAEALPEGTGRILDLGGGWGAIARSVAKFRGVAVDVLDLEPSVAGAPPASDAITFVAGDALDPATWPTDTHGVHYAGVILSYLFSSIPGDAHAPLLKAISDRSADWIAIHDFMIGDGRHAAAWSLQHAVFVPRHRSRSAEQITNMLADIGFGVTVHRPIVDEMTSLIVATRS